MWGQVGGQDTHTVAGGPWAVGAVWSGIQGGSGPIQGVQIVSR